MTFGLKFFLCLNGIFFDFKKISSRYYGFSYAVQFYLADFPFFGQIHEFSRNLIPRKIGTTEIRETKSPQKFWKRGLIREIFQFIIK